MKIEVQNYKDTRSGFGDGLLEAGKRNPKVVGLTADLTGSLKMGDFAKAFPERFFQGARRPGKLVGLHDLRDGDPLAGLAVGVWDSRTELEGIREVSREFVPHMPLEERNALYKGWKRAVERSMKWIEE